MPSDLLRAAIEVDVKNEERISGRAQRSPRGDFSESVGLRREDGHQGSDEALSASPSPFVATDLRPTAIRQRNEVDTAMALEPEKHRRPLYEGSTQYRHWRFSPEKLRTVRATLNSAAVAAIKNAFETDSACPFWSWPSLQAES